MLFFAHDVGKCILIRWEKSVRVAIRGFNAREVEAVGKRNTLSVHARATKNKYFLFFNFTRTVECVSEGSDYHTSRNLRWCHRDDYVGPPRKGTADRLVRVPPHDDGVPHGEFLHPFQISADAPNELVFLPELTVLPDGGDDADAWCVHEEIMTYFSLAYTQKENAHRGARFNPKTV